MSSDVWTTAVPLVGQHVRLEPLTSAHLPDLVTHCSDPLVFQWVRPYPDAEGNVDVGAFVAEALAEVSRGTRLAWAQIRVSDGVAVGSTSFLDVSRLDQRVEIGATFLSTSVWRSAFNTEAKLLLLGHAFDGLGCERVSLKTDHRNERSQTAIARLGAVREGTLRHHMQRADGTWRDTVYFSILRDEWPQVRERLAAAVGPRS